MSAPRKPKQPIYGYLVEYDDSERLLAATRAARAAGYTVMEAYTPLPLHGLPEVLGWRNDLPRIVLGGGIFGALAGYALQYWISAIEYPIDVAGRPLNSWPAFIVPMFEMTVLCAALSAVFGMLWLNGLPQPYHPVFNVPRFVEASRDRFFLMILSRDPRFDLVATRRFLAEQEPLSLEEVPH
jgi:hypothetical protein